MSGILDPMTPLPPPGCPRCGHRVLGPDGSCAYCGPAGAAGPTPAPNHIQVVARPTRHGPEPTCRRCGLTLRAEGPCGRCGHDEREVEGAALRQAQLERLRTENEPTEPGSHR